MTKFQLINTTFIEFEAKRMRLGLNKTLEHRQVVSRAMEIS